MEPRRLKRKVYSFRELVGANHALVGAEEPALEQCGDPMPAHVGDRALPRARLDEQMCFAKLPRPPLSRSPRRIRFSAELAQTSRAHHS